MPTATPVAGTQRCGLYYVLQSDTPAIQETGSDLVLYIVRPGQGVDSWRQQLATFEDIGVQVLLEMHPQPWTLEGDQWIFSSDAGPFLALAEELYQRGALFAINASEEPYAHGYNTVQLQALYTAIKQIADVPIFIPHGSLAYWEEHGVTENLIAPGVCDYCAPHYHPFQASGYQRDEFIAHLEAEKDILQRLAPDSQLVWGIQTFALPTHADGLRMPTYDELLDAYRVTAGYDVAAILYYPHQRIASGHTDWLANHSELWPAVCPGGEPPQPTQTPTPGPAETATPTPTPAPGDDLDPSPPDHEVSVAFIHHSCGANWLSDGLQAEMTANNYTVSNHTSGGTDIGHWPDWFPGRMGELGNAEVIMFKSCFPNSNLRGNPDDPPTTGVNPLVGQPATSDYHTVGNAKGIYNDLLAYFTTRQDRLFVVVTAPPQAEQRTSAAQAANARAFNNWLVHEWLDNYPYDNVAVFDFFNVLTDPGSHHRYNADRIEHVVSGTPYGAYTRSSTDSHPNATGNQKATVEFVPLLNIYCNLW